MRTVEVTDSYNELQLSPHGASFLTDGIILQRYVEIDGHVRKVMTVIKMRGAKRSTAVREYAIAEHGLRVGAIRREYRGVLRGVAIPQKATPKRS